MGGFPSQLRSVVAMLTMRGGLCAVLVHHALTHSHAAAAPTARLLHRLNSEMGGGVRGGVGVRGREIPADIYNSTQSCPTHRDAQKEALALWGWRSKNERSDDKVTNEKVCWSILSVINNSFTKLKKYILFLNYFWLGEFSFLKILKHLWSLSVQNKGFCFTFLFKKHNLNIKKSYDAEWKCWIRSSTKR